MDLLHPVCMALLSGATAAANGVASDAVKSAYDGLKALIKSRIVGSPVDDIEAKVIAGADPASIAESLETLGDPEVDEDLQGAISLLEAALKIERTKDPAMAAGHSLPLPAMLVDSQKISLLQQFPIGPAVERRQFSPNSFAQSMARHLGVMDTAQTARILDNMNTLRAMANTELPERALVVKSAPDPRFTSPDDYWYLVADEASRLGPRMVAAIILEAPIGVWKDYGAYAFHLLHSTRLIA